MGPSHTSALTTTLPKGGVFLCCLQGDGEEGATECLRTTKKDEDG